MLLLRSQESYSLIYLCNLQMGPISFSVCSWQAILASSNETHQLIGAIHKLQRKWSVVNMVPGPLNNLSGLFWSGRHRDRSLLLSLTSISMGATKSKRIYNMDTRFLSGPKRTGTIWWRHRWKTPLTWWRHRWTTSKRVTRTPTWCQPYKTFFIYF